MNQAVIRYATAREKFTELRDRLPQHPAGDLNLAVLIWMEHLYKTRRLQTALYTQEGFYAGGTKSKEGEPIEAGVDKAFRDHVAQAKTKAQKLVDRAPNDPDALYFLGAVYGVLAGYEASAGRKFMSALRNGSRCRELLQDKSENAEDLIRYQYGEAMMVNREYRRAAEQFVAVTRAAAADPDLITWAFLRAGQALDLGGHRNEAIEQYRQALARPNIYDSREQASRCLKKPFREKGGAG